MYVDPITALISYILQAKGIDLREQSLDHTRRGALSDSSTSSGPTDRFHRFHLL